MGVSVVYNNSADVGKLKARRQIDNVAVTAAVCADADADADAEEERECTVFTGASSFPIEYWFLHPPKLKISDKQNRKNEKILNIKFDLK